MELALTLPLLVILLFGAADLARLFYSFQSVESAAAAGAQFGCRSVIQAQNTSAIQTNAILQAMDINMAASNVVINVSSNRITVTCRSAFTTLIAWPGLPRTVPLERTVNMRILQ